MNCDRTYIGEIMLICNKRWFHYFGLSILRQVDSFKATYPKEEKNRQEEDEFERVG
jgi:hypothetical protein